MIIPLIQGMRVSSLDAMLCSSHFIASENKCRIQQSGNENFSSTRDKTMSQISYLDSSERHYPHIYHVYKIRKNILT